jgi:branched-chain amino acid transport system permease protein
MTLTLQYVIDALNVGGLYALMALGIGLIFGIMRLINFAHGEMVMVGGYAMLLLIDLPGPAVVGVSILAVVALALAIERLAFRPLRDAAPSTLLVASFALSYF